jgi:eukaryotic-like serine/threonine-protein kinase
MTLAIGSRIGAFEITGTLGAGGMGEVYRARDTKLDRDVAIKVMPDLLGRNRSGSLDSNAKPRRWHR